jgi:competence protein ComEA
MNMQEETRAASRRVSVSRLAQSSKSGGRGAASSLRGWAPLAGKVAAAAGAAVLLAFIGARAGANPTLAPDPSPPPAAGVAPPSATLANSLESPDAGAGRPPDWPAVARTGTLSDGRIILNTASDEELRRLPGVGPARSRAILVLRERLVRFRSPRDLLRVKGIGQKTLTRMLPMLVLDPPAIGRDGGRP